MTVDLSSQSGDFAVIIGNLLLQILFGDQIFKEHIQCLSLFQLHLFDFFLQRLNIPNWFTILHTANIFKQFGNDRIP